MNFVTLVKLIFIFSLFFFVSCSLVKKNELKYDFKKISKVCFEYVDKVKIEYKGKYYDFDCSGFVRFVLLNSLGVDIDKLLPFYTFSRTMDYYNLFSSRGGIRFSGRVRPGDLVFFDNTYDRNNNGKLDDKITHVGIVVGFCGDSIVFADKSKGKPVTIKFLNLSRPQIHKDDSGCEVNSYIRDDGKYKFLTSYVFAGFGILESIIE